MSRGRRAPGCGVLGPLLVLPGLLLGAPVGADLYRWTDEQGNTHFGDRPPDRQQAADVRVRPNLYQGQPASADAELEPGT